MTRLEDPQPVEGGAFGSFGSMSPAVGDLAGSPVPDSVIGASSGAGTAIAFNGDPASPSALASLFAPAPTSGDEFGFSIAGFGNIAGDAPGEIAIGAPGRRSLYVMSVCAQQFLRTISDPVDQGGSRFGATVAPVGDSNGDGFIDFAVGAPGYDSATAAASGRVYLFLSTGPASAFAGCGGPVDPGEPGGGGGGGGGARNPGGAPKASPPKVNARVLRSLVLRPNRRRLSRGSALRFKGSLKAKAGLSCQRRQKIALQRRKLRGGRYQTFDVAITAKSGAFKIRTRPSRSFLYRARVSQTSVCMGATSKAAKVVVRRR
jgi:hypothetical protein